MFATLHVDKNSRGFTLIELLVVIAIIGVLASVVLAALNTAREKARDARRLSEVHTIETAMEAYYSENGFYPNTNWYCSGDADWQSGNLATALKKWLPTMPVDPINTGKRGGGNWMWTQTAPPYTYGYCVLSTSSSGWNQKSYVIVFRLESQNLTLDGSDGVTNCNSLKFDPPFSDPPGPNDGYLIAEGTSCLQ